MNLSPRLSYIASFVDNNMIIADIGSDHGFLPYYLLKNKIITRAYACDNKKGPFENLKKTFLNNFTNQIELKLKDGLNHLPNYVNTVIMTGMGGDLIIKLLDRDKRYLTNVKYLILSPHSNIKLVREFMVNLGYKLIDEGIVEDDKLYHVLKYEIGKEILTDKELYFGPILLKNKSDLFKKYHLQKLTEFNNLLLLNLNESRKIELMNEINMIKEVLINEK